MSHESEDRRAEEIIGGLTRAELLRRAAGGAVLLSTSGLLAACGSSSSSSATSAPAAAGKSGGHLRVGATGGGAKDSIDAHNATADTDIVRISSLYEPLAAPTADFKNIQMVLAESIEPVKGRADLWDIRLRTGVEFHNGKSMTADDVIFSLLRITDPKNPGTGAASIGYVDRKGIKKLDANTVRVPLTIQNAGFLADLGQYFNSIVPVGYDPKKPVGTGAFAYQSFTPGQQSVFTKFPHYWQSGKPLADQLTIIDFTDDTARINALLSGQIDIADTVPTEQIAQIKSNGNLQLIDNPGGGWLPITMRVDQPPFNDVRVRQAFRLIVDRPQMVAQVLSGHGSVANDIYGRFDPDFDSALPQRQQDIAQAKSLLKQAGHSSLSVTLVTAPVFAGIPEEAQVFAQQASAAGVKVNLQKTDSGTFYGSNYLKWTFAQDFWGPRRYLSQVAQGSLPNSPFNETHWDDPQFKQLIAAARAELNDAKRTQLIHQAQTIEYNTGGYIIAFFPNYIAAAGAKVGGIPAGLQATFLLGPALKDISVA
ncbi:MAG: peptide/nickel transport system substrate-binding protein [Solirubrobacteraceae bacterium]|nr:peptide/nickel transport system substrate-binding protein [Solirubrobacteraceae bacterium]